MPTPVLTPELQTKLETLINLYTQVDEENPNYNLTEEQDETIHEQIYQLKDEITAQVHAQYGPLLQLLTQAHLINIFDGQGLETGWQRQPTTYLGDHQGCIAFELRPN